MRIHWWNDCDPAWPIWQLTVQSTISILSWIGDFTATIISYSASTITHLASCNVGQKLRTTSNRRYCLLPSALRTAVSLSPTSPVASDCARHNRRQLDVPRHQRCTLGRRAFSVAGPIVWNSVTDEMRDDMEDSCFRQSLKTLFFSQY